MILHYPKSIFFPGLKSFGGKIAFFLFWTFIVQFPPQQIVAQQPIAPTVESMGSAKVLDGNWALAKEKALDTALRQAVAIQLAHMTKSETKNFDTEEVDLESILEYGTDYVQSYQILEETRNVYDNLFIIRLKIGLFKTELAEALYELGAKSQKAPAETRILLLIGEKNLVEDGRQLPFSEFEPISEPILSRIFLENDLHLLSRTTVSEMANEVELRKAVKGDIKAAITVGAQCGVSAVIMGTAISRELPPNPQKPDYAATQVSLSLRLIRVDKGAVVGASSELTNGFGEDLETSELEAMTVASTKLADFFVNLVENLWQNE